MTAAPYLARWAALRRQSRPAVADLEALATQAAAAFMDAYYASGRADDALARLLCDMATFAPDPALNRPASQALFRGVVEALCDDFEEVHQGTYRHVMALILQQVCTSPAGTRFQAALARLGLDAAGALAARHRELDAPRPLAADAPAPRLVMLPSRVTVGADVAISSVLIQRLRRRFPDAAVLLLGSPRLAELFGGLAGVRVRSVPYPRHGGLLERLESWLAALVVAEEESRAAAPGAALVIDPDSRITQLGMLPLAAAAQTRLFSSRAGTAAGEPERPMAALANRWADAVLGPAPADLPALWLAAPLQERARAWAAAARAAGCRRLVAISFGTGENPRKRLGDEFERRLLVDVLAAPGTLVYLDMGFGADEQARNAARLAELAADAGLAAAAPRLVRFETDSPAPGPGLVGVEAGIGGLAALIGVADEYIGYDSAGQHIAAALGIPGITVFCGSNNARFIRRWQASGRAPGALVHVDTLSQAGPVDPSTVLRRIGDLRAAAPQARPA